MAYPEYRKNSRDYITHKRFRFSPMKISILKFLSCCIFACAIFFPNPANAYFFIGYDMGANPQPEWQESTLVWMPSYNYTSYGDVHSFPKVNSGFILETGFSQPFSDDSDFGYSLGVSLKSATTSKGLKSGALSDAFGMGYNAMLTYKMLDTLRVGGGLQWQAYRYLDETSQSVPGYIERMDIFGFKTTSGDASKAARARGYVAQAVWSPFCAQIDKCWNMEIGVRYTVIKFNDRHFSSNKVSGDSLGILLGWAY